MSDLIERLRMGNPKGAMGVDMHEAADALVRKHAEIARLKSAIMDMECTCLPGAKPYDGMCPRCMALENTESSDA